MIHKKIPTNVTIIVPTYNESESIESLIKQLSHYLNKLNLTYHILVMDDQSTDDTANKVSQLDTRYHASVVVRKKTRSLSGSVIEGFHLSQSTVSIVMDADNSHPINVLDKMILPILNRKTNITVGVRYTQKGSTQNWPWFRILISCISRLIVKPITSLSDATSGFMGVNTAIVKTLKLNPIGWKIVLEVVIKLNQPIIEIPIIFKNRKLGHSKLSFKVGFDYLIHLIYLYCYTFFKSYKQFLKK